MSAAQRAKRKSATRITFDEDEASLPAKKKTRVEVELAQTNGKTNGLPSRRSKTGMHYRHYVAIGELAQTRVILDFALALG